MKNLTRKQLAEEIEESYPEWIEFILSMKYSAKAAKKFADGYSAKLKSLSPAKATVAVYELNEECLLAGLKAARITMAAASKKFYAENRQETKQVNGSKTSKKIRSRNDKSR